MKAIPLTELKPLVGALSQSITSPPIGGGGAAFSPAELFASGEPGVWLDPSDMSTLFQDSAGTVPVTGAGQPLGRVADKSGNGHHQIQATGASKPTLTADGWMTFDSGDLLSCATNIGGTAVSAFMVLKPTISTQFLCLTDATRSTKFAGVAGSGSSKPHNSAGLPGHYVSGLRLFNASTIYATFADVKAALPSGDKKILEIRSLDLTTWSGLGVGGYASFEFVGDVGEIILIDDPSPIVRAQILNYLADKWNAPLLGESPQEWSYSGDNMPTDNLIRPAELSSAFYTTTATSLTFKTYNGIYTYLPTFAYLGLRVNGVHQKVAVSAVGFNDTVVSLAAGTKQIEVITGMDDVNVPGTYLLNITANAPLQRTDTPNGARLVFYGDSIISGANADPLTLGAAILVRGSAPYPVGLEAASRRALYNDAVDGAARSAFAAHLASWNPDTIWMAIGTNDKGLAHWSAADFGTAYAATLDAIHAALPSVAIYCQTPIVAVNENTPNAFGDVTQDYRDAITTAVSTRTAYATLVDGTAMLTLADLDDGTHPSTAGHAIYAAAIIAELGLV